MSRARAILRSALLTPRDQLGPVATADLLRVLCLIARETERPSPEILDRIGALCASLRQTLERPVGQATGQVQYARVQLIDAVLDASGHSDRARTFLPFALTELRNMEPGGWEVAAEGLGAGEDANLFPCYAAIFLKATRTQDRTTATFSAHWNTVLRRKALSIAMKIQDSPGTRVPVLERIGVVLMCDQLRIACRNAGDESQEREYAIWAATNAQHLISELRGPPVPPPRGMLTAIGQVEGLLTKEARGDLVAAMGKLDGHPEIWPRAPYADPWGPGFLDAAHYLRLSGSSLGQLLPPA